MTHYPLLSGGACPRKRPENNRREGKNRQNVQKIGRGGRKNFKARDAHAERRAGRSGGTQEDVQACLKDFCQRVNPDQPEINPKSTRGGLFLPSFFELFWSPCRLQTWSTRDTGVTSLRCVRIV